MALTAPAPTRRLPVMRERPRLRLVPEAPPRSELSLEDVINTAWAGVRAEVPVACPICDGRMEARISAHGVTAGRCRDCHTELS